MSSMHITGPIRIGIISDEPIRLAGLTSVFDQPGKEGRPPLQPVSGHLQELLSNRTVEYLLVDLHSSLGIEALETIRRLRPDLRMIVIGPAGNEELVLESIMAGARAYLDLKASPETVFQAIEVVTEGSIWAPRKLLSRLIDRLLKPMDTSMSEMASGLTVRERQVLELIMMARSNREIAEQLGIEERTVKAYVGRLMRKAGADNRIKLSMSALSLSLGKPGTSRDRGREAARPPITRR
ncbi:MAG TPA: response regulator transcription factor [Terracidiphilus sp.]|nr:response regulator transcription factor [Terracidiphilus sp.]